MIFWTNVRSEIVDEVGENPGSEQTKCHPEMIANVLILIENT